MSNAQVTLVQIDNYGPWTTSPEPTPEMDLQSLQADLLSELASLVGTRDGYVFYGRFDNMVAVTNGLDLAAHDRIRSTVESRYPVTVSLSVASDPRPARALSRATERLQAAGSAQDRERRSVLRGETLAPGERSETDLQVAHFDVVDATGTYTDRVNAFDAQVAIAEAVVELQRTLRERHDALAFFVGGDNVVAVCPDLGQGAFAETIDRVDAETGVALQVGVGDGPTAREAGMAAKHALEDCRREGVPVRIDDGRATAASD